MLKIAKGVTSAALNFVAVGIVLPLAVDYFAPTISSYIALPPSSARWTAFLLFGALFAVTAFLRNGYAKGDFPWLFGKVGGGLVTIGFLYYLFLFLPSAVGGAGSVESTGLLVLIVLAVVLGYGYLIFDFTDARRTNKQKISEEEGKAAGAPASGTATSFSLARRGLPSPCPS